MALATLRLNIDDVTGPGKVGEILIRPVSSANNTAAWTSTKAARIPLKYADATRAESDPGYSPTYTSLDGTKYPQVTQGAYYEFTVVRVNGTIDGTTFTAQIPASASVDFDDLIPTVPIPSSGSYAYTTAQTDTLLAGKKTDSMSTGKLLGRGTAGTGVIEEITLGTGLSLAGTTLNASGGGGGAVSSVNSQTGAVVLTQDNVADGTTAKQYTATEKTKLAGIATAATANQSDATTNAAIALKAPLADPTFTGVVYSSGGFRFGTVVKSVDYTVLANDPTLIQVTTGATNRTMTMPSAPPAGTLFLVKKVDSGVGIVTVGATVDGKGTPFLQSQFDYMLIAATGTLNNYDLVASNKPLNASTASTDLGTVLSNAGFRASGSSYPITTSGATTFSGTNLLSGNTALTANVRFSTLAKTAAYTVTTSDPYLITGDATTAAFTITLPSTTTQGYIYTIKKIDSTSNAVSVTSAGTPLIDGATTVSLVAQYDFINVMSTTTAGTWRIVAKGLAAQTSSSTVTVNAQSGTSYVLQASDAGKVVEMTNAAANAVTINDVLTTGQEVRIMQTGAGQTTITPGAGVTVNFSSSLTTRAQWSELAIRKRGTNLYVVSGDAT